MSEYLMQDAMMGHTLSDLPQNLSKLVAPVQPEKGGLVTTGANGVWVSPGYKHLLHVCRGSLLGITAAPHEALVFRLPLHPL